MRAARNYFAFSNNGNWFLIDKFDQEIGDGPVLQMQIYSKDGGRKSVWNLFKLMVLLFMRFVVLCLLYWNFV